jgi:hypothetical protein
MGFWHLKSRFKAQKTDKVRSLLPTFYKPNHFAARRGKGAGAEYELTEAMCYFHRWKVHSKISQIANKNLQYEKQHV